MGVVFSLFFAEPQYRRQKIADICNSIKIFYRYRIADSISKCSSYRYRLSAIKIGNYDKKNVHKGEKFLTKMPEKCKNAKKVLIFLRQGTPLYNPPKNIGYRVSYWPFLIEFPIFTGCGCKSDMTLLAFYGQTKPATRCCLVSKNRPELWLQFDIQHAYIRQSKPKKLIFQWA